MSSPGAGGREVSPAREALLDDVMAYAQANGIGDVSLRALAEAIGTSHRMLIYHFGSREGVLAAVVDRVEAGTRVLSTALAQQAHDPADLLRTLWARLADPAMHESERLFFEVVALGLRGRPGTEGLIEHLVEPWLEQGAQAAAVLGLPPGPVRAQSRAAVALIRGLLIDLLATGDRDGTDEALEHFLALSQAALSQTALNAHAAAAAPQVGMPGVP